jgi:riboflavin synthase
MFSGIVEELGTVPAERPDGLVVQAAKALEGVKVGDSLSVNGVCLTVAELKGDKASFSVMPETLRRSNLGGLKPGDRVNLERALAYGDRMGGHMVQGHVDARGDVVAVEPEGNAVLVRIRVPHSLTPYLVEKGFIAVDGVSLTIVSVKDDVFTVSLVEFTRSVTTLGRVRPGAQVNLEVDILAKYVESLVEGRLAAMVRAAVKE